MAARADTRSPMEALSRRVVEPRIGDADIGPLIGEREERVQDLALARHAAGEEAEADRMAHGRAVAGRGDAADHRHGRRDARIDDDLRARAQPRLAVDRHESDEAMPLRIDEARPRQGASSDEISLLAADETAEAEILRRGIAVELRAGDMALLDAHDAHRFGAIGGDAEIPPGRHDRLPYRAAVIGGDAVSAARAAGGTLAAASRRGTARA